MIHLRVPLPIIESLTIHLQVGIVLLPIRGPPQCIQAPEEFIDFQLGLEPAAFPFRRVGDDIGAFLQRRQVVRCESERRYGGGDVCPGGVDFGTRGAPVLVLLRDVAIDGDGLVVYHIGGVRRCCRSGL